MSPVALPGLPRFYLPGELWSEPSVLQGPEHHHLTRVLRKKAGELIVCFDGQGRQGRFVITSVTKNRAALRLEEEEWLPRPAARISLALAWSKSLRRGWLLEKCVELEAQQVIFWQAGRSIGHLPERPKQAMIDQLLAGAKQSGNLWLPELHCQSGGVPGLARICKDFDQLFFLWEKCATESLLDPFRLARPLHTLVVLGPEGGMDDDEAAALEAVGFTAASLGSRVLRWETAALLCLGLGLWGRNQLTIASHQE